MISTYKGIMINSSAEYDFTEGLNQIIGYELRILSNSENSLNVLKYLVDYVLESKNEIKPNQTIAYHSWILKFQLNKNDYLDLWEAKSDGSGYEEGANYAYKIVLEQTDLCKQFNESPIYPSFNQKIVISDGVLEGNKVEAVRYPSPVHMAGWWLTTDLYDGDADTLKVVHYYHVAFERPDLLKYLALPFGFRFYIDDKAEEVWFDEEIINE